MLLSRIAEKSKQYLPLALGIISSVAIYFFVKEELSARLALIAAIIGGSSIFSAIFLTIAIRWTGNKGRKTRKDISDTTKYAATAKDSYWFLEKLNPAIPLPTLSGWALETETAGFLVKTIMEDRPGVVLEIGSGVSTLLSCYALRSNGKGLIYSFDSEEQYYQRTLGLIRAHGMEPHCIVRAAPIEMIEIPGWSGPWLAPGAFESLDTGSIDLLLIDGPPGKLAYQARYPALPILREKLKKGGKILVDDADRVDESSMVERWKDEGFISDYEYFPIGTGLIVARV